MTTPSRAAWLRIAAAVLVLALGALFVSRTEWVEEDEPTPARGDAVTDPYYALHRLATGLGTTFEVRHNLETLPPPGATLVLDAWLWDVFPERRAQLRHWVQAGGQLVIGRDQLWDRGLSDWLPVTHEDPTRKKAADDDEEDGDDEDGDAGDAPAPEPAAASAPKAAASSSTPKGAARRVIPPRETCTRYEEGAHVAPAIAGRHAYTLCSGPIGPRVRVYLRRGEPTWALAKDGTWVAARAPLGKGSVTVHPFAAQFDNEHLAREDHAAFAAAVMQMRPGSTVWVVDSESQPPLPVWLWRHAPAAILLGAAALALWLWRRGRRFGPPIPSPERARRSTLEQVRGLAEFLRHHEPAALQRASRRALEDLARRHLAGYDGLDEAERAQAIATAARLAPAPLAEALRPGPASTPAQWIAASAQLEQARRALREAVVARRSR